MSESPRAVFLSYASQDAEAARRIAEALRAAEIEVWFDQEELRGGDAWDAKIRRQIHACALFMPVISQHTQERVEGYFRREWKLGVDRLNDMAEGTTFVLPVCVDDTREREALVPAAFLDVQWTRLSAGEMPAVFCERVKSLLAPIQPHVPDRPTVRGSTASLATAQPSLTDLAPAKSAPANSIAVLAFANLSRDPDNEYFSDGISEELLNVLAKIPGLRVVARTSAFSFKGRNVSVEEIARSLHVAYVVEGSVRKAGDRVRITAQLISTADGFHVWSDTFDRRLEDIFAVQDEVAQVIVAQVRGKLTGVTADAEARSEIQAEVQAASKGGTRNVEAHRLYLQGLALSHQFSKSGLEGAVERYRNALELDPSFALAWAALSRAYANQGAWGLTTLSLREIYEQVREAAQRALAIEPDLAEGHLAMLQVRLESDFDWAGAEESCRRALALAPANPLILAKAAQLTFPRGRPENAIDLARRAVELDPTSTEMRIWLLWAQLLIGRYEEAEAEAQRLIELNPAAPYGYGGLSMACLLHGRLEAAAAAAERDPHGWSRLSALAMVRHAQGRRAESDAALQQLIAEWSGPAAYQVAWVHGWRDEADQAFAWLERAYAQRDSGIMLLKVDPFLRNLHGDPRWPALLKKARLEE
jgi:TolB-like protein/tetratricopeptide (TPR) repeat protein